MAYGHHPPRYDHKLTAKGKDLWPVLAALRQWGDRWAAPEGPPVEYVHNRCGQVVQVVPTCSGCGEPLALGELRAIVGPRWRRTAARGCADTPESGTAPDLLTRTPGVGVHRRCDSRWHRRRTAGALAPTADTSRQQVRGSPVIGADETGARVDGRTWCQYAAVSAPRGRETA